MGFISFNAFFLFLSIPLYVSVLSSFLSPTLPPSISFMLNSSGKYCPKSASIQFDSWIFDTDQNSNGYVM
jgi:hypothetical protein